MKNYDNPYITNFNAKVEFSGEDERGKYVIITPSFFFPEGGGQKSDTGKIGDALCTDVLEISGEIRHYVDTDLPSNTEVNCEIDKDKRFRKMRHHSGEHIISGIVTKKYGYSNVGFHLSDTDCTCDFSGFLTSDQLKEIEILANSIVCENVDVNVIYLPIDELAGISYRSKINITDDMRIVEIEGYDKCACCAPHVSKTGEIGLIKITSSMSWKGGIRIHIKCGIDALLDYQEKSNEIAGISALLCVPQNQVLSGVKKLLEECHAKDKEIAELKRKKIMSVADSLKQTDGNIVIFEDEADAEGLKTLVNAGVKLCTGICIALSYDKEQYRFSMGSKTIKLKDFSKEMMKSLKMRGGGSDEFISGIISSSQDEIIEFFDSKS